MLSGLVAPSSLPRLVGVVIRHAHAMAIGCISPFIASPRHCYYHRTAYLFSLKSGFQTGVASPIRICFSLWPPRSGPMRNQRLHQPDGTNGVNPQANGMDHTNGSKHSKGDHQRLHKPRGRATQTIARKNLVGVRSQRRLNQPLSHPVMSS